MKSFALQFDGVQNYVSIQGTGSGILQGQANISIAVAFKVQGPMSGNGGSLYGERNTGNADITELRVQQSGILQYLNSNDSGTVNRLSGTTNVADGKMHTAVFAQSGTTIKVYLDGNSTPEISGTIALQTQTLTNLAIRIASDLAGTFFNGTIDDVQIFTRTLSAAEAVAYHTNGLIPNTANLVGSWQMNEGAGTTTANSSGDNKNGTLVGNPLPIWVADLFQSSLIIPKMGLLGAG